MTRYKMVYVLLGALSWGQVASSQSALETQKSAASDKSQQAKTPSVSADTPVITINGLCDQLSVDKNTGSSCKTVITQAQFAKVIEAIQPNMPTRHRREFALRYADALVMTKKAEQMGLDKGANFDEQMRLARIQILSKELNKAIQEKVSQISDKDIEGYYDNNMARFEKVEMDRIHVPKTRQLTGAPVKEPSDADRNKHPQESEQTMKDEADSLRARAVAGEEFSRLQADAYQVAGIKSALPNVRIEIRRASLPPNQASVMDLKLDEVSSVLADPNGYVIYKVKTKTTLPSVEAREEIKALLLSQRVQDEIRAITDSTSPTLDETYFRPIRRNKAR